MKNDTHAASPLAGRDQLSADIAAVAGEAGELLKEYSDQKLQRARLALGEAQSALSGGATELRTAAGDYVHAHPWRAAGVAAAAGLVLGLLLARR